MYIKKIEFLNSCYPTSVEYPFNLDVLRRTNFIEFSTPITFFIGENGSGKSTLLKAIARNRNIQIWQYSDMRRYRANCYEDDLYKYIKINGDTTVGSFFSSDIFRDFAKILDEWAFSDPSLLEYFGNRSLMEQSHGQSHMAFFFNRFKVNGLYLLDEPETALSPSTQIELLNLLRRLAMRGGVQFIIVTHSPILLACPDSDIFSFNSIPIEKVSYEDTDYYKIYKSFLNDRMRYIDK
jgi:predicted ATPase